MVLFFYRTGLIPKRLMLSRVPLRKICWDACRRLRPWGGKSISPSRLNSTREAVQSRASAFSRRYRMNWYKKAHLANTFKWVLREAGCDTSFVDAWTYDVMLHIAEKSPVNE